MSKKMVLLLFINILNSISSSTITMIYLKKNDLRAFKYIDGHAAYRDYKGYYYGCIINDAFTVTNNEIVGQEAYEMYNKLEKEFYKKKYMTLSTKDSDDRLVITKYYCGRQCGKR